MGLNDPISIYSSAPAITFDPQTTLGEAISTLVVHHKHRILLGRGFNVIGVVEPGDMPRLAANMGSRVWRIRLAEIAKPRPPLVSGDLTVLEAARLMSSLGVSTLLVDLDGVPGVFTAWDVVQAIEHDEILTPIGSALSDTPYSHPAVSSRASHDHVAGLMESSGRRYALIGPAQSPWGFIGSVRLLEAWARGESLERAAQELDVYTPCEAPVSRVAAVMADSWSRVALVTSGWRITGSIDEDYIVKLVADMEA